jgi:predicted nucleic-acid-binding Zn-ribbon protein
MKYVEKCPTCGSSELIEKPIVLSGGNNSAFLIVNAAVCLHCGKRLYTPETVRQFEKAQLEKMAAPYETQETYGFQEIGRTFQVAV